MKNRNKFIYLNREKYIFIEIQIIGISSKTGKRLYLMTDLKLERIAGLNEKKIERMSSTFAGK